MEPHELTVVDAARRLRDGDVTAERYTEALLDRAAAHASLNAFIVLDRAQTLEAARAADKTRASGGELGPLHGVPLAIKDNLDVVGYATTGGTPALRGNNPRKNAAVAQMLIDAGAVMFGKANMHELAFGITSNNAAFGAARNPHDLSRIPGGSSGGTAAAVAARLTPAGIGTDTGGSVRVPAALCGIVGFRPTTGRWPITGILPISHTRDTAGPMARSVADCVLLDAVVTGSEATPPKALSTLRIGVPRKFFCDPLDGEVAGLFKHALEKSRAAGVPLVDVDLSAAEELNGRAGPAISRFEARHDLNAYLREHGLNLDFEAVVARVASPDVKAILEGARSLTEAEYREALRVRSELQKLYAECFARHGIGGVIFPTTPLPAAKIGEDAITDLNGRPVSTFAIFTRNSGPGSVAGIPGISLPIGKTASGLPVGIEFDGPAGGDAELLAIARGLEAAWRTL